MSEQREDLVFVARGEVTQPDKVLIRQLLGRFGLNTYVISADEYRTPQEQAEYNRRSQPKTLELLSSRNDFLVREHFEEFQRYRDNPNVRRINITAGRIFNSIVDTRKYSRRDSEPVPIEGLVVQPRESLGLAPYKSTLQNMSLHSLKLATYAIQVGSFIDTVETEVQGVSPSKSQIYRTDLAQFLRIQVQ